MTTKNCHNWLTENLDQTFAAVAIELHNLDALLYEIEHSEVKCEDCMEIAQSYIDKLSEVSESYKNRLAHIKTKT